jgi:hypothetical protein
MLNARSKEVKRPIDIATFYEEIPVIGVGEVSLEIIKELL